MNSIEQFKKVFKSVFDYSKSITNFSNILNDLVNSFEGCALIVSKHFYDISKIAAEITKDEDVEDAEDVEDVEDEDEDVEDEDAEDVEDEDEDVEDE